MVVRCIPRLLRKPRVFFYWLGTAYWALLMLVVVVVLMPTLVSPAVDQAMEWLFPPVSTELFFGLINHSVEDPRLLPIQELVKIILWCFGIGGVFLLFWLDIPQALLRATKKARKREQQADKLLGSQPSQSILLYRAAISLASDPEYESHLQGKIQYLDQQLSLIAQSKPVVPVDKPAQTQLLAENDLSGKPVTSSVINNRYLLKAELGRGGMGVVYLAHDSLLDRDVALKELPTHSLNNELHTTRFQQEARALARLTHPYIVQIYDFITESQRIFIAMEYVNGRGLDEYLDTLNKMSVEDASLLTRRLAEAMAYAHERGVIHRDFKPGNVLLTHGLVPKITDFGLAKITESSINTQIGTVMGSPAYMSPEQALGESTDQRTDIYSLGIILYRLLTGKLPFEGDSKSIMAQHINCEPVPPREIDPRLPDNLNTLILSMLAKAPEQRLPSMNKVLVML